MNKWVLIALSYAVLAGCLYWSVESKGKLKAQNDQFVVTVEEMTAEAKLQRDKAIRDNQLQAEARKESEQLKREADDLRQELEVLGGCAAQRIDADSAQRLQ